MKYVLALDQGTTSSRAILFDEAGGPVALGQREFRQIFPQAGWVEHDPREIFQTQRDVARDALRKSGISTKDLLAIGITNQRETTIVWDRQTGEPIANAIVWQDRRTAGLCKDLREVGAESLIRERTGLVIDPYFSGTKLACTRSDRQDFIETPIWRRRSRKRSAPIRSPGRASAPGFLFLERQRRCKHGVRRTDMDRISMNRHLRLEQQRKPVALCEADTRAHRAEEIF